jgi:MSHA biogenesis protein MshP
MTRHIYTPQRACRSAGVGLVTAIFLLVVLAGLGVAMVTLFTTQQASAAMDEQGARAYQAARAGIEWGLFQKAHKTFCPTDPNVTSASTAITMPPGTSLSAFTVTVNCERRYGVDGDDPLARYFLTAVACNLPANGNCPNITNNPDYVARQLEVEI